MTISLTGFSHHTCPVELRERLSFPEERISPALLKLKQELHEGGVVILSTCNRVEVYTRDDASSEELQEKVRVFLSAWHDIEPEAFAKHVYEYADREAVAHLFRVTSSLDSMVVGEDQILGQVHDAYLVAQAEGATDKILNALFQRAFKVAKEVRTKTNINVGKVSVASVAVDLAASIFGDLSEKTVLVIGSGETGELALKSLVGHGVGQVLVANRTFSKAEVIAERYHGEALALADLQDFLHRADIIISSTSAKEPILMAADFKQALRKREQAPMFVIDIAVPRDVDAQVTELDNVYCYDMDDLESVAAQNLESRRAEMDTCLKMVENQVDRFIHWRKSLYAEPTIVSMTRELNAIRERELEKTLGTLPDLTEKQRAEVEYLTKRIVNNILQRPMRQIKQEVTREDPSRVLHLVKRLFGLEEGTG
ncbi:MAG: glutamyl-tRNA reductase [Candidatus Hydrogenedentes bacterium]|nr:glutamyl-tRNA reductase [Candidatus Hydrogenedentota bacterium]